jgi:hypothetical protein
MLEEAPMTASQHKAFELRQFIVRQYLAEC